MGAVAPSFPWPLLLSALLCAAVVEGAGRNPKVIRLTFRNDSGTPAAVLPDRLLPRTAPAVRGDLPLVFCRDAEYPAHVLCDVGMLLERDVFPTNMVLVAANTAIPDPVRVGKFCKVEFDSLGDDEVNPMRFKEIGCGIDREIVSEDSLNVPSGVDSMAALPRFKVANMTDLVLTSYSGFGCMHRLKRHRVATTKRPVRGSFFQLDSFFCSIGFGVAEGRPETPYPPQQYYKHDGRRWRPVGIWPDYV